jgi:hypothetical protein
MLIVAAGEGQVATGYASDEFLEQPGIGIGRRAVA